VFRQAGCPVALPGDRGGGGGAVCHHPGVREAAQQEAPGGGGCHGWTPVSQSVLVYCDIIYIRWTVNLVYIVGRAIHKFKIAMKYMYSFIFVMLHIM